MFYTYLRGLVVLLLWSINGNAHYHNTDKIPNQDENYILVAPHIRIHQPKIRLVKSSFLAINMNCFGLVAKAM